MYIPPNGGVVNYKACECQLNRSDLPMAYCNAMSWNIELKRLKELIWLKSLNNGLFSIHVVKCLPCTNRCVFFCFQESELSFSYTASTDSDETLVAGRWTSDDSELKPYRTVLALSADKFDKALEGINTLLTQ